MIKIYVVSEPRSASVFLMQSIQNCFNTSVFVNKIEYEWKMLNEENAFYVFISRNPKDLIISALTMYYFNQNKNDYSDLDEQINKRIKTYNDNVDTYINYMNLFLPFTFEQVINNTENVLKIIADKTNNKIKNNLPILSRENIVNNNHFQYLKKSADSNHYYNINKIIKPNHFDQSLQQYNKINNLIYEKQRQLGIDGIINI